jgi:hypothetical protein
MTTMSVFPASSPRTLFSICHSPDGRWSARRGDGLIGGTFFEHDAALRFAERESGDAVALIIEDGRQSPSSRAAQQAAGRP